MVYPVQGEIDLWDEADRLAGFDSMRCLYPMPVRVSTDFASQITARRGSSTLLGRAINWVNATDVFPFNRLLGVFRRRALNIVEAEYLLVDQPAPWRSGQTQVE